MHAALLISWYDVRGSGKAKRRAERSTCKKRHSCHCLSNTSSIDAYECNRNSRYLSFLWSFLSKCTCPLAPSVCLVLSFASFSQSLTLIPSFSALARRMFLSLHLPPSLNITLLFLCVSCPRCLSFRVCRSAFFSPFLSVCITPLRTPSLLAIDSLPSLLYFLSPSINLSLCRCMSACMSHYGIASNVMLYSQYTFTTRPNVVS